MKKGEMLSKMILMATSAHAGQFDRGGRPYILHPLAVMQIANTDDEELQCIAVGHDIIEDTPTTYMDLIEAGMSERVIKAIRLLTKQPGQTLDEYKAGIFSNKDAMLIKKADLQHNSDINRLKGVSEKDINRMAKYHMFFLEIKQKLGEM